MVQDSIRVNENMRLYLRVPRNMPEEGIDFSLHLPKELAGRYLKLEVLDEQVEDIPVKSCCSEEQCLNCGVVHCMVHYGNAELKDVPGGIVEKKEDARPTIPGHPKCHFGECANCHVVSCGIYQGYEPEPDWPR